MVDPTGEIAFVAPALAYALGYETVTVSVTCSVTCTTLITGALAAGGTYVITQYTSSNFYQSMEKFGSYLYDTTHPNDNNDAIANTSSTSTAGSPSPNGGNKNKNDGTKKPAYKEPKPGVNGKDGAKDIPSWAKGNRPFVGESGKDFAKRLMDEKYGRGKYDTGPNSPFNQIKKYGDRNFRDPPKASQ